jgi:pyridoxine 5-phosphate synthase
MAATKEMKDLCLQILPESCCIVPERREELTTEGGLDVKNQMDYLGTFLPDLLNKTKVSLFIDPDFDQIYASKKLGVHAVELHTGKYSNLFRENKQHPELTRINEAAKLCCDIGLDCHAGHGLNFENVKDISQIDEILELNVGHFLVSHSLYTGLKDTILKFMKIIDHPKSK